MESSLENEYLNTLSEKEKKALEIAKEHLQSLFTLTQTTGFIEWKNRKNNKLNK